MKIVGIIPARYGSTRFPGKPLHPIAGKPLLQHVWERCGEAGELDDLLIATDDARIAEAAKAFGARVAMTAPSHVSGTDRIAEAVSEVPDCSHVINIQGDEPLIHPALIDRLANRLRHDSAIDMITAAVRDTGGAGLEDPNIVKVVLNKDGDALYFSRSVIPHQKPESPAAPRYRHKGIYGYSKDFLLQFVRWAPSPLETAEGLEQLRALENGARIRVVITSDDSIGVDTPAQAQEVERLLAATVNHRSPDPATN